MSKMQRRACTVSFSAWASSTFWAIARSRTFRRF